LIGEPQKNVVYYRCHTKGCPTKCLRQDTIDRAAQDAFGPLCFSDEEKKILIEALEEVRGDLTKQWEAETNSVRLRVSQMRERFNRLTDAYLERMIDKETFESRKKSDRRQLELPADDN
jgi:site-specific DNA recombinase